MGLRKSDLQVLEMAATNANIFTEYYFSGLLLQDWQLYLHHASQPNLQVIGGVGSGKTMGVGLSAATWAAMTPNFGFMDVAPTSWQASLMYDLILGHAEAGLYGNKFIVDTKRKPYPEIILYNGSKLLFMTAQDDIARLRGWEGDWMNGDEFGFINTFRMTVAIMRTRLRGKSTAGRHRLGRLSVCTTATDNVELWERFDRGVPSNKNYLSFTVRTADNPHLTSRDIELMEEDIPEEIRLVEMDGQRPTGRGVFFPISVVQACEDHTLNDFLFELTSSKTNGAIYEEDSRNGVTRFQFPYLSNHEYLIVADPGTGNVPRRNSAVVMVFDITGFPFEENSVIRMVAFAWISGYGRYEPFEVQYKTWWEYYRCRHNAAIEATGPQRSIAEYAFTLGLDGQSMNIEAADMSGNKKMEALQALIQLFQRALIRMPFIRGARTQLVSYKLPDDKLSQDIVSTFMVAAKWIRQWRIWSSNDLSASQTTSEELISEYTRESLESRPQR